MPTRKRKPWNAGKVLFPELLGLPREPRPEPAPVGPPAPGFTHVMGDGVPRIEKKQPATPPADKSKPAATD
jgi:hypothetical protein